MRAEERIFALELAPRSGYSPADGLVRLEVGGLVLAAAVVLDSAARAALEGVVVLAAVAAARAEGLGFGVGGHFRGEGFLSVCPEHHFGGVVLIEGVNVSVCILVLDGFD